MRLAYAAVLIALAAGIAACDSTQTRPVAQAQPTVVAAPPEAPAVAPPTPAPAPAWMREPRDDADRALLRRLLDPAGDVRKAAVEEWETARVASWDVVMKEPRFAPPWPSHDPAPDEWEREDDASPPRSPGDAIRKAFDNRTRALARGLVAALREGDVPTRIAAAKSMGEMRLPTGKHLTQALADSEAEVRVAAARAVSSLRPYQESYPACLPAMCKLLDDPDWRVRVEGCSGVATYDDPSSGLHDIAEAAVSRLIELASDEHAEVRVEALYAVGSIRPYRRDAEVQTVFAKALADSAPDVRSRAAIWFGHEATRLDAKPLPAPIVESLRGLLTSPDAAVRRCAAYAVWNSTHDAAAVVGIYAESVAESHGLQLIGSLRTLAEIGPDAESAVPAVLSVLTEDTYARFFGTGTEAMDALYAIGPSATTTLPILQPMLADTDPAKRAAAARAVATLDGDAAACEGVLARALSREQEPRVRAAIHLSRGALAVGGDALVVDLVRGLRSPESEQWGAIDGLRAMGPPAAAAAPDLETIVAAGGRGSSAATALAAVGGPARAAAMLIHVNGYDGQRDVERIVESVGPADAAIVPALLEHLDESPVVIARALAEIGPAAKAALPALARRLNGPPAEESIAAVEAVLRIGGNSDRALKVLMGAIEADLAKSQDSPEDDRAVQAAYALFRAGDAARPAVPTLRKAAVALRRLGLPVAASLALWRVAGETDRLAFIVERIASWSPTPPIELVESIGAMGPGAAPATSALERVALEWQRAWMKESEADVCRAAIRSLGQIGPGAASALPSLRRLRRNALFHAAAEEAIRRIEQ